MRKSGKELIAARKKAKRWLDRGKTWREVQQYLGYKSTGGVRTLMGMRSGAVHKSPAKPQKAQ
jgi:hypothetical protein